LYDARSGFLNSTHDEAAEQQLRSRKERVQFAQLFPGISLIFRRVDSYVRLTMNAVW